MPRPTLLTSPRSLGFHSGDKTMIVDVPCVQVSRVASGIAEAEAVASAVSAKGSRGAAKRLAEAENKGNAGTCALCVCSQADSCLSKPPNVPLKNPPKGPCYSASKLFEASWKCPRPGSANSCLRPTANPPLSKKPPVSRLARSGGLL